MRRDRDIEWSNNRSAIRIGTLRVSEDSSKPQEIPESVRLFVRRSRFLPLTYVFVLVRHLRTKRSGRLSAKASGSNPKGIRHNNHGRRILQGETGTYEFPTVAHFYGCFGMRKNGGRAVAGLIEFLRVVSDVAIVLRVIFSINVNSDDLILQSNDTARHRRGFCRISFFCQYAKLRRKFLAGFHGFALRERQQKFILCRRPISAA